MDWRWFAAVAAFAFVGPAVAQTGKAPNRDPSRPPVISRSLERFASEAQFLEYVRSVQGRTRRGSYEYADGVPPPPPPPPPPPVAAAPSVGAAAQSRAAQPSVPEGSSITNVQTQGVDEGGIVKQIGRFLVVLQDGRLFVADMRAGGRPELALADRANVYRSPGADTWYDELLTSGNRILVTGYSYRERASEITTFTLNMETGALTREATYYISSNDYFSADNYATRLVNGNLVIYTPLAVNSINASGPVRWPLIRRWLRDEDRRAVTTRGRPLFDATSIYRPLRESQSPVIHSVSVCPLDRADEDVECQTTAFVGDSQREFFVSPTDIFLWVTPASWETGQRCNSATPPRPDAHAAQATIYQIPMRYGASPRAMFALGAPSDQLSMDSAGGEFRALLRWNTSPCARSDSAELRYFRVPLTQFSRTPSQARPDRYVEAPSPEARSYETRFVGDYVVYGAAGQRGNYPPEASAGPQSARVIALPVARPRSPTVVEAPHGILRVERAGSDVILTGYRTDEGLSVSVLELRARPRIVETQVLRGRYESEGRTHAFNALVGPDGAGLMGLPTVSGVKQGGRWVWRSQASDLSFLALSPERRLTALGELTANDRATDPSYRCEVSCIDWYGNSRALFTDGRVFALSGTELIEGELVGHSIRERRRLNLSAPLAARR